MLRMLRERHSPDDPMGQLVETKTTTTEACQKECLLTPGCSVWTWFKESSKCVKVLPGLMPDPDGEGARAAPTTSSEPTATQLRRRRGAEPAPKNDTAPPLTNL